MFICLNQSLYDTRSNISCDNGKLKVRRQINSEVITQLYLGIITFTMGRELLLRVCLLLTFDNFFSSWYLNLLQDFQDNFRQTNL